MTRARNTAGVLVKPKGMTRYSVSKVSNKGCFPLISFVDSYRVIGITEIDVYFDRNLSKPMEVNARPESFILLFDKGLQEAGQLRSHTDGVGSVRRPNPY